LYTDERHVNCCNPEAKDNGGWGIFNAILGWQNSATIGSVTSYCIYWVFVTLALIVMRIDENRVARGQATLWRSMLGKGPKPVVHHHESISEGSSEDGVDSSIKKGITPGAERDLQNLAV
jgi:high-affinity iron transporter